MSSSLAFAVALALAPALATWWTGRRLVQRLDDPAFPELLLAQGQRLATITIAGMILLGIFVGEHWYWSLPVLFLALLISRYPLRRTLYGEQWSLGAYVRFGVFSTIGGFGLWFAAVFMPNYILAVVSRYAPGDDPRRAATLAGVLGLLFAAVLIFWQRHYAALWLHLHRATPIAQRASPSLLARFDEVLDRAGAALSRRPAVYRYGVAGGYIMNAVAIPSLHAPAVAFGDTLLDAMTEDEVVAVFAHEVAHHEQFTARRLRQSRWFAIAIVLLAAALPTVALLVMPQAASVFALAVPVAIAIALGRHAAKSRADETASDRRAVTLTGNPGALASALKKLHVLSRVPRRWPHDFERVASHPSLARRIQAIEEQGSVPATPLGAPTAFRSTKPGFAVVLDDARAHWFEGLPADAPLDLATLRERASSYRAIAYADLTELRVAALDDERVLKATDRGGRSWVVALAPGDVHAVQTALDVVDVRLGTVKSTTLSSPLVVRTLAGLLFIALGLAGEMGMMLIPIAITAIRPSRAAMLATGVMALARALVAATGRGVESDMLVLGVALTAATAAALLYTAFRAGKRDDESSTLESDTTAASAWREARVMITALGGMALLLLVSVSPMLLQAPRTAGSHPLTLTLATAVLGLGVAMMTLRRRPSRIGGVATSVSAAIALVGITGDGWLYGRTPSLPWVERSARPLATTPVDPGSFYMELSPGGKHFVVRRPLSSRGEDGRMVRFLIGSVSGDTIAVSRRTMEASAFVFLDDDRALVLSPAGDDSLELRVRGFRGAALADGPADTVWARRMHDLDDTQLFVDRSRSAWTVVGRDPERYDLVIVTGVIGSDSVSMRTVPREDEVTRVLAAFSNGTALAPTMPRPTSGPFASPWLLGLASMTWQWNVTRLGAGKQEVIGRMPGFPVCGTLVTGDAVLCTELGQRRSRVWRAPSEGALVEVAELPRGYDISHVMDGGRLVAYSRFDSRVGLLDLPNRRGTRVRFPVEAGTSVNRRWTSDASWAGDYLAVLSNGERGSRLTIYRLD